MEGYTGWSSTIRTTGPLASWRRPSQNAIHVAALSGPGDRGPWSLTRNSLSHELERTLTTLDVSCEDWEALRRVSLQLDRLV